MASRFTTLVRHPLVVRHVTVDMLQTISDQIVRIRVVGSALDGFISAAPDDHIKVLFPSDPGHALSLPSVIDGSLHWNSEAPRPIGRDYTPIVDAAEPRVLHFEMVIHPGGHATEWASTARVGDPLGVAGPRGSYALCADPSAAVLIGDDSAVPAIRNWCSVLAPSCAVTVVLDGGYPDTVREVIGRPGVRLIRTNSERGESLASVVAALGGQPDDAFWWAAGEADETAALRSIIRNDHSVGPDRLSARGYWRRGVANHQEPHED